MVWALYTGSALVGTGAASKYIWAGLQKLDIFWAGQYKNSLRMEGGKKVSLRHFLADQKIMSSWKKWGFGASYSMSNKLLLVARYILTMGLQKMPSKLAV